MKSKKKTKKAAGTGSSLALAKRIAAIAADHKAIDIVALDLHRLTSFTDYFVIASGASDRQVQAIADSIEDELRKEGRRPLGEEGAKSGHWVLLDYGDVVAHIFYSSEREHYQLERLWRDAPRVSISEAAGKAIKKKTKKTAVTGKKKT